MVNLETRNKLHYGFIIIPAVILTVNATFLFLMVFNSFHI